MEKRHVRQIHERFPASKEKIHMVTSYAGNDVEVKDLPDSGYGDVVRWMRHCHSIILPSIEVIVDRLARENDGKSNQLSEKVD